MREPRSPLRLVAGLALVVIATSVLIGVFAPQPVDRAGYLFPSSVTPEGARAMADVLQDNGVEVAAQRRYEQLLAAEGRDRTLLIVGSSSLSAQALSTLDDVAHRIVIVQPSSQNLQALELPLTSTQVRTTDPIEPDCAWPAAVNAGGTELDGDLYRVAGQTPAGLTLCYPVPDAADGFTTGMIATLQRGETEYILLGSDQVLRNDSVTQPGRAAIGVWALGADSELMWWNVDPLDPGLTDENAQVDPFDLVPPWWNRVHWWVIVVALLAIIWRARRMGRLVPEPLPVIVRSAETARGRAALYRRAGARDRAAAILRSDALRRLARRFGLPSSAPVAEIAHVVSAQSPGLATQGLGLDQVTWILAGPAPTTDRELAGLADDLDRLLAATDPEILPMSPTRKASS